MLKTICQLAYNFYKIAKACIFSDRYLKIPNLINFKTL